MPADIKLFMVEAMGHISDVMSKHFREMVASGVKPKDAAEALFEVAYNTLFDSAVIHESLAGRLPMGYKSKDVKAVEGLHESMAHKICDAAIRRLEKVSKYKFVCWITRQQKPL